MSSFVRSLYTLRTRDCGPNASQQMCLILMHTSCIGSIQRVCMMSSAKKRKADGGLAAALADPFGLLVAKCLNPGDAIGTIRSRLSLSQGEFGDLIEGFSQTNIARYESGSSEPPIDFWRKLTRTTSVSISWIFARSGNPYVVGFENTNEKDRAYRYLVDRFEFDSSRRTIESTLYPPAAVFFGLRGIEWLKEVLESRRKNREAVDQLLDDVDEDFLGYRQHPEAAAKELDEAAQRVKRQQADKRSKKKSG